MAYVKLASLSAASSGGNTFTSGTMSTTGASLLVAVVASYNGASEPTLSDSGSNTWTPLTLTGQGSTQVRMSYVNSSSPTTSGSHSVTVTGTGSYASVAFVAFSGSASSPIDQFNHTESGSATAAPTGSITPSVNGTALIAAIGFDAATSGLSIDNGFTLLEFIAFSGGNNNGVGLAWKEQATAAAINPQFSWVTSNVSATQIASFLPGGGGGGGTRPVKMAGPWGGYAGASGGFAG